MIQKIREAIGLLADHLTLFSLIVLTIWLPASIFLTYMRLYVLPESSSGDELYLIIQELRISSLIEFTFGPLYIGALIHALSQIKQGQHPRYGESMSHGARKCFKLFTTRLITGLIIAVGFVALIVPGVILSLRYSLVDEAVILENLQGNEARHLSVQLTRGKRWQVLGSLVLLTIALVIILSGLNIALYLPLTLMGQQDNFLIDLLYECISSVMFLLPTILLFLFYWEARNQRSQPQSISE